MNIKISNFPSGSLMPISFNSIKYRGIGPLNRNFVKPRIRNTHKDHFTVNCNLAEVGSKFDKIEIRILPKVL